MARDHGTELPKRTVTEMRATRSAKTVAALAWAAGLGMRTAIQIQLRHGNVAPKTVLNAKAGTDYPLGPDELKFHVELFAS